jgi:hypothetical protein
LIDTTPSLNQHIFPWLAKPGSLLWQKFNFCRNERRFMVYQGFSRIRTFAVAAMLLSFSIAGINDVQARSVPHYSFLGGLSTTGSPLQLVTNVAMEDDLGRLMWYRTQNLRFQIVEHQGGPLSFILSTIITIGGTMYMKGADNLWRPDNIGRSPSGNSVLTFDLSDEYWSIRGESLWLPIMGYALGYHRFRELKSHKQQFELDDTASATYRFLTKEKAMYIEGVSGIDIDLMFRYPFLDLNWLSSEIKLDAPIVYMICAPVVFFGGMEKSAMGAIYGFGIPRLYAQTSVHFGPLAVRGSVAAPTRFLVIPWYFKAAELSVTGGLCF